VTALAAVPDQPEPTDPGSIDDYMAKMAELADALAEATIAAEKVSTLDKATATAALFHSDDWLPWALELVPLPKNPSGPYGRREHTRIRFHKATMAELERTGHRPYGRFVTDQLISAGDVVTYIPKVSLAHFSNVRQVRALGVLMREGHAERIPEVVALATKDGMVPPTGENIAEAVKIVRHKLNAHGGLRHAPLADEATIVARGKAEDAYQAFMKKARKSPNGREQLQQFLDYIKADLKKFGRRD